MSSFGNLLVCGLLQVTLVAAVGLVVVAISGRWSRLSAVWFSCVTLFAIVLLTGLSFVPWPSWLDEATTSAEMGSVASIRSNLAIGDAVADSLAKANNVTKPVPFGFADFMSAGVEGLRNLNRMEIPASSKAVAIDDSAGVPAGSTLTRWFVWLFAAGVIVGLIRLVGGIVGIRLMVRSSRPLRNSKLQETIDVLCAELRCAGLIEVRESTRLATAATVGWRRPVILISDTWKSWADDQLRCVLAHEIAHIARGDFASTVAAQLGLVLHFYHPLVHWLVNRLRLEQELAADAMAARVVGGSQAYLRAIGELALMQSKEHVSWPAHAFLPTRRTFLRRIEMLRDMKMLSDRAPLALRVSSLIAVLAVTLAVAGIRPPGTSSPPQTMAGQPSPVTRTAEPVAVQEATTMQAKYVPANVLAVAVLRPSELVPIYKQARKKVEGDLSDNERTAIDVMGKCNMATVVVSNIDQPGSDPLGVMLSFSDKSARDAATKVLLPGNDFQKEKFLLTEIEVQGLQAMYYANDTTLIFGATDTVKSMALAGPSSLSLLTQTDAWAAAVKGTIAVAVDPGSVKTIMASAPPNPIVGMFSPFWMQADSHTLGISLGETAEIKLVSTSPDEKSAKMIQNSMTAAVSMLTGMLASQKANVPEPMQPAMDSIEELLASQSVVRNGNQTTLIFTGDASVQVDAIVGLLAPAVGNARLAAQRQQQQNNMKQIMLAMHNYADIFGSLPPAVVVDAASGAKRSWRVELLPYLEHAALYQQYRKDQPWDSEANKAVLAKMPSVFRHPSVPEGTTNASIFAAVGKGLIFEKDDKEGTKFAAILDGTSNTICILEAKRDIPWTKPEDIAMEVDANKLPELGFQPLGFQVGICDGSVQFIANNIDLKIWNALLTRAGGEVINQF